MLLLFYCESLCVADFKHQDRNKFEKVRTKDTTIYKNTLAICKNRNDKQVKSIERSLLVIWLQQRRNIMFHAELIFRNLCHKTKLLVVQFPQKR